MAAVSCFARSKLMIHCKLRSDMQVSSQLHDLQKSLVSACTACIRTQGFTYAHDCARLHRMTCRHTVTRILDGPFLFQKERASMEAHASDMLHQMACRQTATARTARACRKLMYCTQCRSCLSTYSSICSGQTHIYIELHGPSRLS